MTMSLRHSAVPTAGRAEADREVMAYDDVRGGATYRVPHGNGAGRSRCLRYIGRRFGKKGQEEMNRIEDFVCGDSLEIMKKKETERRRDHE